MKYAFSFSPSLVEVVSESLMFAIAWVRLRLKMRRVRIRVRCLDRTSILTSDLTTGVRPLFFGHRQRGLYGVWNESPSKGLDASDIL
jgi:hypothetical protein